MTAPKTNLLLDALSPDLRSEILALTKEVRLPVGMSLQEEHQTPEFGYFLTSGVASVVVRLKKDGAAEVAILGREGVVGGLALLGPTPGTTCCFMQIAGAGYRIPMSHLRKIFLDCEPVRARVLESIQVQALTESQIAACDKLHETEPRLARWLLMARARVDDDVLNLTQEFMAQMLGVQRTTVALAAGSLRQNGLIEYRRGRVKIVSVEALEAAACDCYPVTKNLLSGLYR